VPHLLNGVRHGVGRSAGGPFSPRTHGILQEPFVLGEKGLPL